MHVIAFLCINLTHLHFFLEIEALPRFSCLLGGWQLPRLIKSASLCTAALPVCNNDTLPRSVFRLRCNFTVHNHLFDLCLIYPLNPLPVHSEWEMQRGIPALQTCVSQPQYLIPASYYHTKQGHQSPSRKEALRGCFGCGPSYEFLIGIPAPQSEVEVKVLSTESVTLSQNTPNKQFSIRYSPNSFIFIFFFRFNSPGWAWELSPRARLLDPTNFLSVPCAFYHDCWFVFVELLMLSQSVFNHELCLSRPNSIIHHVCSTSCSAAMTALMQINLQPTTRRELVAVICLSLVRFGESCIVCCNISQSFICQWQDQHSRIRSI